VVAVVIVIGLMVSLAAALFSSGGASSPSTPQATDAAATRGPSQAQLQTLAADLSSGEKARVLAAIADIPPGAESAALKSLGSLTAVTFDPATLRFDAATGAAVVDAKLTDSSGKVRREREVLVLRGGRWLLYSALVPATATGSPVQ